MIRISMDNLEKFFLARYLKSPKRNLLRFSFVFMTLGIIISVGILSAGLNLFEGYEKSLKDVLLGSFPHLSLQKSSGEYLSIDESNFLMKALRQKKAIKAVNPVIQFSVMATGAQKVRGASLNAYSFDTEKDMPFSKYVHSGRSLPKSGEIIVGRYLAKELGKGLNDTLKVVYPRLDRISALGIFPSGFTFRIVGIYASGFYENDRSMLICMEADARAILNVQPGFSKLEISLDSRNVERASEIASELQTDLGDNYTLYPWTMFSAGLLRLVSMEKWLIFIIFSFLVLIAGINVISTVTTIILDKKNEIAVLKTLGANALSVKRVLSLQVGLVSLISILCGQLLGALISFAVEKQTLYKLKGDVYFIDSLKTNISVLNQVVIFTVAFILVMLCIYYPLKQIDRQQIIELLRNP